MNDWSHSKYRANPSSHDFDIYKSFVSLAIVGQLSSADSILAKRIHRTAVERVAGYLVATQPTPLNPLYRGILLSPPVAPTISTKHSTNRFVSFSEDPAVACWFADASSWMATTVLTKYPNATGWIGKYTPTKPIEILFHWSWKDYLNQNPPSLYDVIQQLAIANGENPSQWVYELQWSLKTQKEVILKPGPQLTLEDVATQNCPPSNVLDKRFRPRPDFVLAPSGLQSYGIPPQQRLNIVDIELPQPFITCPACHQVAVEVVYVLDRARFKVWNCNACGNKSFVQVN